MVFLKVDIEIVFSGNISLNNQLCVTAFNFFDVSKICVQIIFIIVIIITIIWMTLTLWLTDIKLMRLYWFFRYWLHGNVRFVRWLLCLQHGKWSALTSPAFLHLNIVIYSSLLLSLVLFAWFWIIDWQMLN